MFINTEDYFSILASKMNASAIRKASKLAQGLGILSLTSGSPDPDTFPGNDIKEIVQNILSTNSARALQYSSTEGLSELRKCILDHLAKDGNNGKLENIMISSGSQQGLDLIGKVFLNPGDIAIVELPSYLAALNAFHSYGGELVGITMDDEGMQMDILEEKLTQLKNEGKKVKFIYTISNFQNPAGVTMSLARRKKIIEIAHKFNVFIVEDNPYEQLRFEGNPTPSIYSLDNIGFVISLGTFSKIVCPGLRVGWILGNKEIIRKIVILKQATDLCTSILNQLIVYEYIKLGKLEENIKSNIQIYKKKRNVMLNALEKHFPKEAAWTKPQGGFFVMVTLPEYINADEMFKEAIEGKVAYAPGGPFFANGKGQNTMRLSFSQLSIENIEEGIKRLGKVINRRMVNLS